MLAIANLVLGNMPNVKLGLPTKDIDATVLRGMQGNDAMKVSICQYKLESQFNEIGLRNWNKNKLVLHQLKTLIPVILEDGDRHCDKQF